MQRRVSPLLMGQCAGSIDEVLPAAQIVEEMMQGAIDTLRGGTSLIAPAPQGKLTARL